ncbi:hypothetical protein RZS28_05415 [Methylocapsa polymorpha]|uniref:Uncharacterized protein n=1 Tax=Methylocapsa polymorpha TaxID=3080828 RepID=A0ABZ0HTW9_9HYPH|nr:hypothetical protein RZS28_05415 [Methylocapsa sp. RX1]
MSYLVFGLGLLLSLCGGAAAYFGYGIVAVERGWASLIAGATALSCGIITIALGFILRSLGKLQAVLEADRGTKPLLREPAQGGGANPSWAPQEQALDLESPLGFGEGASPIQAPPAAEPIAEASAPPVEPLGDHRGRARIFSARPREDASVSPVSIDDVRRLVAAKIKRSPSAPPQSSASEDYKAGASGARESGKVNSAPAANMTSAPVFEREAEPRHPGDGTGWSGSSPGAAARPPETETAPIAAPFRAASKQIDEGAGRQTAVRQAEAEVHETARLVSESQASRAQLPPEPRPGGAEAASSSASLHRLEEGPAIVGRHESDGTSYVMYADGSIDAQSERGIFHFNSMADLKAFIESQG